MIYFYFSSNHFFETLFRKAALSTQLRGDESPSNKAYQTIKCKLTLDGTLIYTLSIFQHTTLECKNNNQTANLLSGIMTLKRKLRRIRSNVQSNLKEANVLMSPEESSTFASSSMDRTYDDEDDTDEKFNEDEEFLLASERN